MKAYISCPISVGTSKIIEVANTVRKLEYNPTWWEKGTAYTEDKLRDASIFILMSEHNSFDYCLDDMTLGCRKELALAKSLGKTLYMAYWKIKGEKLNIYPINLRHLEDGRVLGESGCYLGEVPKVINNYSIY